MTVADRIRLKRESLGWSQKDLAEKLGLKDKSSVTKIETSGNKITLKNIEKIADALGCSVQYLMGWDQIKTDYVVRDNKDVLHLVEVTEGFDEDSFMRLFEYAEFLKSKQKKEGEDHVE